MQMTANQLIVLVQQAILEQPASLHRNSIARKLGQVQTGLAHFAGLSVEIPVLPQKELVEPTPDFGKPSEPPSEPEEEEKDAATSDDEDGAPVKYRRRKKE